MLNLLLLLVILNISLIYPCTKAQIGTLKDFDFIDVPKIRSKRSLSDNKEIHINTKLKNFKVILNPNKHLFAKGFKAFSVDKHGNQKEVFVDPSQYYEGYVSGIPQSYVSADLTVGDEITMNIDDGDDLYKIEPASRYDERKGNKSIVYRLRDIISNSTVKRQPPIKPHQTMAEKFNDIIRSKRDANTDDSNNILSETSILNGDDESSRKKYCTIDLIADYRFHKKFGKNNKHKTHRYLIEIMDSINQLYKKTVFIDNANKQYKGLGFIIRKILVHEEPTITNGHYNELKIGMVDIWNYQSLLYQFSSQTASDVCLSHLFTYQSFSSGTLGLAYMASYKDYDQGGMCSRSSRYPIGGFYSNTAWSTYMDAAGNPLVSMSAYLVTAHELGHNVGSDHDPDTNICSPPSGKGGKYIMYTYSVVGYERNNRKFSPCSIRTIGETLRRHSAKCLKSESEVQTEYCGNQRIEEGEECDVGKSNLDKCCDSNCKLRQGALCSPDNHQCCTEECQLSQRSTVCAETSPQHMCLGNAQCTGLSKHCPAPTKLSGPNCTEHGQCRDGVCQPFCQHFLQLEACICDHVSDSCHICCLDNTSSSDSPLCKPAHHFFKSRDISPNTPKYHLTLNDGRPCLQGMCQKGVCKQNRNNLIQRIWKIIDNFNTNLFVGLLLDNLVFVVIILSLIVWIPASLLVNYYDKRANSNMYQHSFRSLRK